MGVDMTIEVSASGLSFTDSEEEDQSLLTQPDKPGELLVSKGSTFVARTPKENTREAIKRYKSYKSGKKKAVKVNIARLREEPIRGVRDRSSGYRRKQS